MTEQQSDPRQVLVIGPDGSPDGSPEGSPEGSAAGDGRPSGIEAFVSAPDKVMRIGTMIKQLLDEVKAAPLDDASRSRLRQIHERSITELASGLSDELRDELERITLPLTSESPSDPELRIAQAQLVGWLEGLFHGIQTTLVAQQMVARNQLEEMHRRALPTGEGPGGRGASGPYL
jgi:hypothetical protein